MKEWIRELSKKRKKVHSQSGQDGILEEIFRQISPTSKFCVEFGFNTDTLSGGSGPNVANLVMNHGWECLLIDGGHENLEINLHKHHITPDNICNLFEQYNVPNVPGFVSIDVDSTDLWLFKAVVQKYRADVFTVEFNSNYPNNETITVIPTPYGPWEADMCYGASLGALDLVARENGYSLVHVEGVLDAFFIRDDLIYDGSDQICHDISIWKQYPMRNHIPLKTKWGDDQDKINEKLDQLLDYSVYTVADAHSIPEDEKITKAIQAARPICEKYIL